MASGLSLPKHWWVDPDRLLGRSSWRSFLDHIGPDAERVRMFLISHLIGPFIGLGLLGYVITLQGGVTPSLLTLLFSVAGFWLYPVALRLLGGFKLLALVSLQHLTFVILFASHLYGGISSPFFFWLLVVPLFGFFYLGDVATLRFVIVVGLAANVGLYVATYQFFRPAAAGISLAQSETMYLFSVLGAAIYVMMMALAHARLLSKQALLMSEAKAQRLISEQLLFAKEAAQAASRAKTEFLATTSHELRTPLNAIIGFSQLIRSQKLGPLSDNYADYMRDIEESGKHLLEIINDILDIAKAESGRFDLMEEEVDVRQTIAASLRLLHARAAKSRIAISVRVSADIPRLHADRRRIKQTLLNLLGNAIKFTPAGGSIVVKAGVEPDGSFAIGVSDSGIGIAKENIEKVTLPFSQVDNSLARHREGVGLGLPLASTIMLRHGGKLELASEPGKGTRAIMRFPGARVVSMKRPPPALGNPVQ